jgi:hypothetical protein
MTWKVSQSSVVMEKAHILKEVMASQLSCKSWLVDYWVAIPIFPNHPTRHQLLAFELETRTVSSLVVQKAGGGCDTHHIHWWLNPQRLGGGKSLSAG